MYQHLFGRYKTSVMLRLLMGSRLYKTLENPLRD